MKNFYNKSAQTFVEYTMLLGIVFAIYLVLTPLIRRGTQGFIKVVADQVGNQQRADQSGGKGGYFVKADIFSRAEKDRTVTYRSDYYRFDEEEDTQTISEQSLNQGYTQINQVLAVTVGS